MPLVHGLRFDDIGGDVYGGTPAAVPDLVPTALVLALLGSWVDDGPVITSSGVSAGTDMSLAIIQRIWGEEMARTVAEFAEYTWHENADSDPFTSELNKASAILGL